MDTSPVNPTLRDIFQTALRDDTAKRQPPASGGPTTVLINGDNNVVSYGGAVHVHRAPALPQKAGKT